MKNQENGMVKVGFSKVPLMDVMPEQRQTDMPISARGFYISQREHHSFFLISDFMDFDLRIVSLLEKAVKSVLPAGTKIHIMTTHNHGGASWFQLDIENYAGHAAECAKEAVRSSRTAKIRIAHGRIGKKLSIGRRIFVPEANGSFTCFYGIDSVAKDNASYFVETALKNLADGHLTFSGKYASGDMIRSFPKADPTVSFLEFSALEDDRPLGNIVRFAAHAVCCNLPGSYSSDYPGYLCLFLEKQLGGISVFMNGPCAEIAPAISGKSAQSGKKIAEALGKEVLNLLEKVPFQQLRRFRDTIWGISLPVRKEILDQNIIFSESCAPRDLHQSKVFLEQQLLLGNLPFLTRIYKNGEKKTSGKITVSTALFELNDWNILCFPGETFFITAQQIISEFPGRNWITVTEHGRTAMYIPPESEYRSGGYEPNCAVVSEQGEKELRMRMISLLQDRFSSKSISYKTEMK